MFRVTSGKGFHITFANGWTVSVQFGSGSYCENRYIPYGVETPPCPTAEIAAWDKDGKWHRFEYDTVAGYCKPDEVLDFMNMVAAKGKPQYRMEESFNHEDIHHGMYTIYNPDGVEICEVLGEDEAKALLSHLNRG